MPANTTVRARIDAELKEKAETILATVGLTTSDAFRLMMHRIVAEQRLPFEPLVPNARTIKAMTDARAGRTKPVASIASLFKNARR